VFESCHLLSGTCSFSYLKSLFGLYTVDSFSSLMIQEHVTSLERILHHQRSSLLLISALWVYIPHLNTARRQCVEWPFFSSLRDCLQLYPSCHIEEKLIHDMQWRPRTLGWFNSLPSNLLYHLLYFLPSTSHIPCLCSLSFFIFCHITLECALHDGSEPVVCVAQAESQTPRSVLLAIKVQ
jgi:hypothetical protein